MMSCLRRGLNFDRDILFAQIGLRDLQILGLVVFAQMLEMGRKHVSPLRHYIGHNLALIVGLGFPLDHADGPLGAIIQAGSQPVAKQISYQPGLAINYLQGTFRAIRDTDPTAVAFCLVDLNDLAFHGLVSYSLLECAVPEEKSLI
jgi:hypothetical protein